MFKDNLKNLREQKNLSQQQLADIIFVSRSAIAKWENGNGVPSNVNLKAICEYFGVEEEWLLDRDELKETIKTIDEKQKNIKIMFLASTISILIFCLVVGGSYYLHRIAIVFCIGFFIFKLFLKDNKVNRLLSFLFSSTSLLLSIINWFITALAEPNDFFRVFTFLFNLYDYYHLSTSTTISAINLALSQFSSIINVLMLVAIYVISAIISGKEQTNEKVIRNKKRNLFIVAVFSVIIFSAILLWCLGTDKMAKWQIKREFKKYNDEYSLNLPTKFKTVYTHKMTSIDSYEYLMVVSVNSDYELEYNNQCESKIHDDFDIIEHFDKASDNTKELLEISKTLSEDYDWYAYEERNGNRTYNLFVIRDNETNYLFVYFVVTQITDCF